MLIYVQKVIYGRTDRQTQNYGSERNKMKIFKIDYSRYFMVKNGIYCIIFSKTLIILESSNGPAGPNNVSLNTFWKHIWRWPERFL